MIKLGDFFLNVIVSSQIFSISNITPDFRSSHKHLSESIDYNSDDLISRFNSKQTVISIKVSADIPLDFYIYPYV
jgi:hypothetical protein